MVAAVRFGDIAIGIVKIPLAARGACVVARSGLRVHAKLGHQTGANIVKVKVTADAKLRYLDFVGTKYFTRAADSVVFWMIEIINVVNVGSDFWSKEAGGVGRVFCTGAAVQPREIGERKRISGLRFGRSRFVFFRGLRRPDGCSDGIFCNVDEICGGTALRYG